MLNQLIINQELEVKIKNTLKEYYQSIGYFQPDEAAKIEMSLETYATRFEYLRATLPDKIFSEFSKILVSGTSVGSEMIFASYYNFAEIHGVEVDPFLVKICDQRLMEFKNMFPKLYDGQNLPYENNQFDIIISGHIIEHTENPFNYLTEHLRVLKYGGYLFIEFPTRYHYQELHTSLPSFEWLPKLLRDNILNLLSGKYSPVNRDTKLRYKTIIDTKLKQISLVEIKRWISKTGYNPTIVHQYKPSSGIVRCIFKK
ncbi:MAG: methyltransferase domain-containing protein [Calothrix sp. MO_192.B10]|nr:methyltransferase domain-containing protein [Calothrix sp. MO_192.B10]